MAFKTKHKDDLFVLQSEDKKQVAVISPKQGGRTVQLLLNDTMVIDEPTQTSYETDFAGAILFPFANRIANGTYRFQNKSYFLTCNENGRSNAIHGLVYDKNFQVSLTEANENFAKVELIYDEKDPVEGFPFTYQLKLIYVLSNEGLDLHVEATNTGENKFLFSLGWHPYFCVDNFEKAYVDLESKYQVIMNEHMITVGSKNHKQAREIYLKDNFLDDCFSILDRKVDLVMPSRKVSISGEYTSKFIQLYTPKNEKLIAIEPMTAISNSFNNKKSILVLHPNETFKTKWNVQINNNH